jgi:hypothetical protein|tara:strand:+ start:1074 stop:1508 length:435 start_codon:yes stop_codon:yes gene_type:complete
MKLLISEVLQKVSNAKTKAAKVKLLREHNTPALRSVLIINYDESVISLLPVGDVPYEVNDAPAGTEHTKLEHEYRKLYLFFKGGSNSIKQSKREDLFIQMLEGLHKSEATLLILSKDKDLQKKYKVTKAVVTESFPEIQWGGRS